MVSQRSLNLPKTVEKDSSESTAIYPTTSAPSTLSEQHDLSLESRDRPKEPYQRREKGPYRMPMSSPSLIIIVLILRPYFSRPFNALAPWPPVATCVTS